MKNELKCVVRMEDNKPIIFFASEESNPNISCFTFSEGHNESSVEYMRGLPLANQETSQKTLQEYQNYLNSLPAETIYVAQRKRLKLR